MEISHPSWNTEKRTYTFEIEVNDISACSILTHGLYGLDAPPYNDISGIVSMFLAESAQYFQSPIRPEYFIARVKHNWADVEDLGFAGTPRVRWIPTTIRIFTSRFEIDWEVNSIEKDIIPSGFVEGPVETPISPELEGAVDLLPVTRARRRVREARLRVAAARLRAEHLVESYYKKYGDSILTDSDSLSSDS